MKKVNINDFGFNLDAIQDPEQKKFMESILGMMAVIINDYTALEDRVAANTKAMGKYLSRLERSVTRELKNQRFAAYLSRRL